MVLDHVTGKIAVIGAGSWGTAQAHLLAGNGVRVNLWVREEKVFRQIRDGRENKVFLPGVQLNDLVNPVMCFEEALDGTDIVAVVVPSHVFRVVLEAMRAHVRDETIMVAATKGIENDTLMVMSDVAGDVFGASVKERFGCIAGPSFAKEVARRLPTAVTVACTDLKIAGTIQRIWNSDFFRVYVSKDIIGCEIAGALKNVIAIAAGACDGLGFGLNARAALITRGLAEIARVGVALGADPRTFAGLAGMGDLVLTCTGDLSRNRTVGVEIGRGRKIDEITESMKMVAEGVKTTRSAYELGVRMGVEMPITEQVFQIMYQGKDPKKAVKELMARELKRELEG